MRFLSNHDEFLQAIIESSEDEDGEGGNDDEEEVFLDRDEGKWAIEEKLPADASVVATFENKIENWTTWTSEKTFYVCQIPSENNAFLLFQLDWDDNWEKWQFDSCAAVADATDKESATLQLLREFAQSSIPNSGGGAWEAFLRSFL